MNEDRWPALPYTDWQETCSALHLWTQIVGKYRLAHTPWVNHSWHATLYPVSRGLATGPIPDPNGTMTLFFDLVDHRLVGDGQGRRASFALEAMSVAEFLDRTTRLIEQLGGVPTVHGRPNEIPDALPFAQDTAERPYDRDAVERFHRILLSVQNVFQRFRTGFLGKVSPVHLFWGALDLAVTRFSGREAPLHPGGVPGLPDDVVREAYSHEVSSAGFWPGNGGVGEPMFYCYAYPEPDGFRDAEIRPEESRYDDDLGEFLLPYEAVRRAPRPESALFAFLESTYSAAASKASWPRQQLECETGRPRVPRPLSASLRK